MRLARIAVCVLPALVLAGLSVPSAQAAVTSTGVRCTVVGTAGDDDLTGDTGADDLDGGVGSNICIVDTADESQRCRYDEQPPVVVETQIDPGTDDTWEGDLLLPQGTPPGTDHVLVFVDDIEHSTGFVGPSYPGDTTGWRTLADDPIVVVRDTRP